MVAWCQFWCQLESQLWAGECSAVHTRVSLDCFDLMGFNGWFAALCSYGHRRAIGTKKGFRVRYIQPGSATYPLYNIFIPFGQPPSRNLSLGSKDAARQFSLYSSEE